MAKPVVYGPTYSTYVRTVRLALAEKGVEYDLVDVAMLQGGHQEPAFLARNPFAKVPAFEHDGFGLYETAAVTRYIDRAFPGPSLQPADVKLLARMDQIVGIIDSFAYGSLVGKVVWQRMVVPMLGGACDEAVVAEAAPAVRTATAELARLAGGGPWLVGDALSLADLHLAPVFGYFSGTPEGAAALAEEPALGAWWAAMAARPSMAATEPVFG